MQYLTISKATSLKRRNIWGYSCADTWPTRTQLHSCSSHRQLQQKRIICYVSSGCIVWNSPAFRQISNAFLVGSPISAGINISTCLMAPSALILPFRICEQKKNSVKFVHQSFFFETYRSHHFQDTVRVAHDFLALGKLSLTESLYLIHGRFRFTHTNGSHHFTGFRQLLHGGCLFEYSFALSKNLWNFNKQDLHFPPNLKKVEPIQQQQPQTFARSFWNLNSNQTCTDQLTFSIVYRDVLYLHQRNWNWHVSSTRGGWQEDALITGIERNRLMIRFRCTHGNSSANSSTLGTWLG